MARKAKRGPIFLWIGGVCFLAGSLAVGITGLASASAGPSTVIANQGAAGTSPWPVSGVLGISNFPSGYDVNNFPSGFNVNNWPLSQAVSGTVGLDPAHNGVSVNFPATQNIAGNVGVTGSLPAGTNDLGTVHVAPSTSDAESGSASANGGSGFDIQINRTGRPAIQTQTVSMLVYLPSGTDLSFCGVFGDGAGTGMFMLPMTKQGTYSGQDVWVGTEEIALHYGLSDWIHGQCRTATNVDAGTAQLSVSGVQSS